MLVIKNFSKIEGSEFQLSSGNKFLIGIAKDEGFHYTFGVFPLAVNGVAIIKDVIVYKLHRALLNRRGYGMTSAEMKQDVFVKPANLTLKNFVLELHIQTAKICS
jgi:uncharacterized membrane protein